MTGLSINQKIDSNLVAVIDTNRQNVLSNLIQKLVKEKKEPDLDLKTCNEEMKLDNSLSREKNAPEPPLTKLTFYNASTKTQEEIEFYDYMMHLEKFGFLWVENDLELRYSIELSTNKKN